MNVAKVQRNPKISFEIRKKPQLCVEHSDIPRSENRPIFKKNTLGHCLFFKNEKLR